MFQDGSGSISAKELLLVMRSIGQNPTEDEILELIMEADLNGDGTISYDEFTKMMRKKSLQQDQTEVRVCVLSDRANAASTSNHKSCEAYF